jgi:hypothetical protein
MGSTGSGSGRSAGTWLAAAAALQVALAIALFVVAARVREARGPLLVTAVLLALVGVALLAVAVVIRARMGQPTEVGSSSSAGQAPGWEPTWSAAAGVPAGPIAPTDPIGPAPAGAETLEQVRQALETSGAQAAEPFARAEQGGYTVDQLRQYLRVHGVDGTARIETMQDTGRSIGDDRLIVMQVTVMVPGQPPHLSATAAAMVPQDKVPRLSLGAVLPCKVAPDNPDALTFEWERI